MFHGSSQTKPARKYSFPTVTRTPQITTEMKLSESQISMTVHAG